MHCHGPIGERPWHARITSGVASRNCRDIISRGLIAVPPWTGKNTTSLLLKTYEKIRTIRDEALNNENVYGEMESTSRHNKTNYFINI